MAACDWSNMSRCYFRLTGSLSNARTLCFLSEIVIIIIILLLSGEICLLKQSVVFSHILFIEEIYLNLFENSSEISLTLR